RTIAKILARAPISRVALAIPVPAAKIFARAPIALAVGRTARKFLVAAEFSLGPIAIALRPCTIGTISPGAITLFAKTFAARRVGPLLTTLARRIRFLLAEFPVGELAGRTRLA